MAKDNFARFMALQALDNSGGSDNAKIDELSEKMKNLETNMSNIVALSQSEYDSLTEKTADFYFIKEV